MTDSHDAHDETGALGRRTFLRAAGALAAAAAIGCDANPRDERSPRAAGAGGDGGDGDAPAPRDVGFHRATLDAVGAAVLPAALGDAGRERAVREFVAWIEGYAPVAERMHGYGDAEIRWLPPDPAPNWRAQLEGLDLLARRAHGAPFAALDGGVRRAIVERAIERATSGAGDRLPAPLDAPHVALALLAHWAGRPAAWDLAHGARIAPATCRPLDAVTRAPLPLAPTT